MTPQDRRWPAPFVLHRHSDPTGVSDVGRVASGVRWPDGRATLRWDTGTPPAGFHRAVRQVATFEAVEEIEAVHGHQGATVLRWQEPTTQDSPRLCAVLGAGMRQEVWWWAAQWTGDGPTVTYRVPTRFRRRHSPQLTYWPAGAAAVMDDLGDGLSVPMRLAWLPDEADLVNAVLPPPTAAITPLSVDSLAVNR